VRNVELNQLNNDIRLKQTDVDNCDPQAAQTRHTQSAIDENTKWVNQQRDQLVTASNEYNKQLKTLNQIVNANKPMNQYLGTLDNQLDGLGKKHVRFEQAERTQRRNFLDNNPQEGVGGVPGVRTRDDRILLSFWICYGLALVATAYVILTMLEVQYPTTTKQKVIIVGGALGVGYGLAYYIITAYA
jgi:ABC-type transporter Mla subunit MlaD